DQIFVALAGQPRRRQAANKIRLMTNLAYSYPVGRRCGGGGSRPCRPALAREISRCGAKVCLREAFGKGRHDQVFAISTLVVVQLLHEKIFRLTPDDRNGCINGYPVLAMA